MSTKIYNAYILPIYNMEDLVSDLRKLSKRMDKAVLKHASTHCPMDGWSLKTYDRAREAHDKHMRAPDIDYGCDITFFPEGYKLAFVVFAEQKFQRDMVVRAFKAKDWHYQNSTDKPDDISEREWREREKFWEKHLGWDTPAMSGLSFTLHDWQPPFQHEINQFLEKGKKK